MITSTLEAETLKGGGDEELLEWAFSNGRRPSDITQNVQSAVERCSRDSYLRRVIWRAQFRGGSQVHQSRPFVEAPR
jgi:hypothetical protein